jgi:hypothetical protein
MFLKLVSRFQKLHVWYLPKACLPPQLAPCTTSCTFLLKSCPPYKANCHSIHVNHFMCIHKQLSFFKMDTLINTYTTYPSMNTLFLFMPNIYSITPNLDTMKSTFCTFPKMKIHLGILGTPFIPTYIPFTMECVWMSFNFT